jgi:hypothetical protein
MQSGAAGASGAVDFGFVGGFAPGSVEQPVPMDAGEAAPTAAPTEAAPAEAPVAPEKKDPLADLIRKQREDRQAREVDARKAKDAEAKVAEAHGEVEKLKRSLSEFEADPIGYARAAQWSKEKQVYIGQMLLYDLAPDKATPDIRQRLFEAKQALREKERATQAETDRQRQAQERDRSTYTNFVAQVREAAGSFEAGGYPESEDWFGEDRDNYAQSLVATAVNLQRAAEAQGKVADLRPENLARVLEQEIARRMSARDTRRGGRQPAEPVQRLAQGAGGRLPADSTKGMTGAGTPRPKALTDAERIARAAEVAFRKPGARG